MVEKKKISIARNLIKSFLPGKGGFMARKLTAFAFMWMIAYCCGRYLNTENVVDIIIVFCVMVLLLLAVVTIEDFLKFYLTWKNEKQHSNNSNGASPAGTDTSSVEQCPNDKGVCQTCGQHLPQ
jgi:hypothetical protein